VRVRGEIDEVQAAGVRGGELDGGECLEVLALEPGGGEAANRWYTIVVRGASGLELRRLLERQGLVVSRVLRTGLGSLTLDRALPRGRFRKLESSEIEALLAEAPPAGGAAAGHAFSAGRRSSRPSRRGSRARAGRDTAR
jgi:23S rRNA pseudouridine2605 synthase